MSKRRPRPHAQKKIREINSGFYAFDVPALYEHIDRLSTANAHGEYYLTDMAGVFHRARKKVVAIKTEDAGEVLGSNTRAEMVMLDARVRLAKCRELLDEGVTIFYPHTCVIDSDVQVGADTVIEPFVQLLGKTKIAADCRIRSYSVIGNSVLGNGVTVKPGTIMEEFRVGAGAVLGPTLICVREAKWAKALTSATLLRPRRSSWVKAQRPIT